MMTSHVLARVLIASGLTALIGITAVVHFGRPLVQSVPPQAEANALPSVQSVWTEVEASAPPSVLVVRSAPDRLSASIPAQDTPSATRPPATVAATPLQDPAPAAQPAVTERTMATGSLAAQAPTADVLAPAPAPLAQPTPATRVEAPATSTSSDPKRVNINTASVNELNGLGGRLGKAIIRRRPYRSIEDLVSKRILTRAVFNRIKDRIVAR